MLTIRNRSRLYGIFIFFTFTFLLFACRLIYLQFIKYPYFREKADNQHSFLLTLEPKRGCFYDRNIRRLTYNLKVNSIYAVPPYVDRKEETASSLAQILKVDEDTLLKRLNKKKAFIWVKRKVSDEELEKVMALDIKGLGLIEENKRFYPNGTLASHILGFVDIDNRGLEGLEFLYDRYLKGEPGWKEVVRDAKCREIASEKTKSLPPSNGYDVILTLDEIIQHIAEKALDKAWQKHRAKGAMVIVMDPNNGHILALANRPTYDPNYFNNVPVDYRRNKSVTDCFEPGSTFKIVTASAVLNEGVVKFNDVFFCENGSWNYEGHELHDHKPYGNLTFKEVIEHSSNIGTVKVALRLKEKNLYRYIKKFGFGAYTGVDLPGEVSGMLQTPSEWSKFTISSIPMGQEIGVTAIQMVCAISAIASDGIYYRPMIVKEIRDERGQTIKAFKPTPIRRIISEESAIKTKRLLKGVIENGTGTFARPKGYTAAGKTGTAQKLDPGGRYSHSKYIASFIGFTPAEEPKIAICVFVDEPKHLYYGSVVAAPVFKEIAEETLNYLEFEEHSVAKAIE